VLVDLTGINGNELPSTPPASPMKFCLMGKRERHIGGSEELRFECRHGRSCLEDLRQSAAIVCALVGRVAIAGIAWCHFCY
jgi:hypothetical protein